MANSYRPQQNRRRGARREPKRSTRVRVHKGMMGLGPNVALSVLDLSESGIRLMVKEELQKNQEVEVNLDSIHHRRPLKVLGNVVWCVPATDGNFITAVHFQRGLPYGEVLVLTVT